MAKHIILILFLCLTYSIYAQKTKLETDPPKPLTKKEAEIESRNHNCIKKTNKSFSSRLNNYPFNLATRIQFVSFKGAVDTSFFQDMKMRDSLPRLNDSICYSKLSEVTTLSFVQVDKLTDILYNYGWSGPTRTMNLAGCYNPRNAILFLDKNDKAFEFIEICFECDQTRESSTQISLGEMCDQKLEMLKELFRKIGIEYGITKGLMFGN